ncbi:MAG: hypothetical protein AVDCRST_MAG77-5351 [uncultured Chloroflexi bacterium]|uniref:Uncharacterized protein n=1 Tax=uncultured Chloroflexota bacterium TaxID=166587 RepID=A0A6J4K968_9CHLR|nr:MAG: hypothetical protein AVDCRST_MAG77-5351 [uncultured Chloroflexota bacterium]
MTDYARTATRRATHPRFFTLVDPHNRLPADERDRRAYYAMKAENARRNYRRWKGRQQRAEGQTHAAA